MSADCRNCVFYYETKNYDAATRMLGRKKNGMCRIGDKYIGNVVGGCRDYQPDPGYVACVQEDALRKRHGEEEKRRRYEEASGEPYLPVGVRAAIGLATHLFKK